MREIDGTIEAMERQLKSVISDYCIQLGCKECPFKNNCLASTLENSIYEKQKRQANVNKTCQHFFELDSLKGDIVCIKCKISNYLL